VAAVESDAERDPRRAAGGFSTNTCLPALAAWMICFMCSECGVARITAPMSGSLSTLP